MNTIKSVSTELLPVTKADRIVFLDSIRGIAVLGILIMNIMAQGQPDIFYLNMNLSQSATGLNFYSWLVGVGLFNGAMRGLFSLLFGAGSLLLLDRLERNSAGLNAADIFYRRLLWLIALGLLNAYVFLWPGDILFEYGLIGLTLFPFRKMSAKKLLVPIIILLLFGTYRESSIQNDLKLIIANGRQVELFQKQHKSLTDQQSSALKEFQQYKNSHNAQAAIQEANEKISKVKNSHLPGLLKIIAEETIYLESVFLYNHWWDVALMFFIGMAFYRSGFLTGKSKTWIYVIVAVGGLGISLTLNYLNLKDIYDAKFDFVKITEDAPLLKIYQIKRILQVSGYLSVFILLSKWNVLRWFFKLMANVGQVALTNYLSQSIITSIIFYGFGYYGQLERYQLIEIVFAIWLFQIIFSAVWLRYFLYGPFEWAWRSLTYLKVQKFKISNK